MQFWNIVKSQHILLYTFFESLFTLFVENILFRTFIYLIYLNSFQNEKTFYY